MQRQHPAILTHIQTLPEKANIYMSSVAQTELLICVELDASEERKQELQVLHDQVIAEVTEILLITPQVAA